MNENNSENELNEYIPYAASEGTEDASEGISEETSEGASEEDSEVVTEVVLPEETLAQITEIHSIFLVSFVLLSTVFFLWVFDFVYKKLLHLF